MPLILATTTSKYPWCLEYAASAAYVTLLSLMHIERFTVAGKRQILRCLQEQMQSLEQQKK